MNLSLISPVGRLKAKKEPFPLISVKWLFVVIKFFTPFLKKAPVFTDCSNRLSSSITPIILESRLSLKRSTQPSPQNSELSCEGMASWLIYTPEIWNFFAKVTISGGVFSPQLL